MDIQDLKVFQIVAKRESISKAAQELSFVQSSVTSKIKKLEAHFQTPLFHRHRYGVTLTAAGRDLLTYTHQILHLYTEAEKSIIYADSPKGSIAIGSMETTAAVRLPPALSSFNLHYPDVELSLSTGPTKELIERVLAYELDGAFVAGPVNNQDLLQSAMIEEELVLISQKKESALKSALNVKQSTLLVFRQGCSYRRKLEEWLHAEQIMPHKMMEFGSLEAIIGCVHAGLGISLLPKSVITKIEHHYSLVCYEIPKKFANVTTVFIQRKDGVVTLALQKFIEIVQLNFGIETP